MDVDIQGPLNEQQKTHLRTTWEVIFAKENRMKFAVSLFRNLFKAHPEYQQLFRSLRDIEDQQKLFKSAQLKAHGYRVVSTLNQMIESLETPDIFVEMLKNLARSHHGHGVSRKQFEHLGPVLLETFAEYLEDKFTPKVKDSWLVAYGFIVDSIWGEYVVIGEESASTNGGSSPEK